MQKGQHGGALDVVIVGAGISGINAACRLSDNLPHLSYTILEGRHTFGGTWDLFKYPGIRSDSDLHTFGYAFRAWKGPAIARAPAILEYLNNVAEEYGLPAQTKFFTKVQQARWSSVERLWTFKTINIQTGKGEEYQARFYFNCCGYYDYNQPMKTSIPGLDNFDGVVVHPQFWNLNEEQYKNKKIVVIGSGATAITLLPALADKAAHVTQLQRSPSYVVAVNPIDPLADLLQRMLPERWASFAIRQKNVAFTYTVYHFGRAFPSIMRNVILARTKKLLPDDLPLDPHFTPKHNPWDQRIGLAPNGDFYQALQEKNASIVTGNIKTIHEKQIILDSGAKIDADIIVTATGLRLQIDGGVEIFVDDKQVSMSERFIWRGCMIEGVPNYAFCMGYINLPWTLGSDCTAHFVVRLLAYMSKTGNSTVFPQPNKRSELVESRLLEWTSTFVEKAAPTLPKVATQGPWKRRNNYWLDMWNAKYASFDQLVFIYYA